MIPVLVPEPGDELADVLQAPMPTVKGWLSQPPALVVCGRVVSQHDAEIITGFAAALEARAAKQLDEPIDLWPVAGHG